MSLDDVFREQIGKRPREAKSHFEVVDPGSWRLDRQDALIGLGVDWVGPFRFDLDGVTYEAFGLRSRIVSSQRQFLADMGISYHEGGWSPKFLLVGIVALAVVCLVCTIAFLACNSPREPHSSEIKTNMSAVDELFARAEARRQSNHRVDNVSKVNVESEQKTVATKGTSASGLRERARIAFRDGKWAEAIALADQLTEETVDAELMYYIGIAYKEGFSVEHDFSEALYWFKKSADGGNAASQYEMGLANEKGNGISKNESEAARWYRISADRGNAPANLSLGILYEEGRGVVQNASEAAKFYRRGSELGNAHAGYLLGRLYEDGRGVPLSLPKAADCYRKAGGAGHALAGYNLGKMYEKGRGVQKDLGEALFWYEKAGKLGNAAAMTDWQRLRGTDKRWLHPEK